MPLDAFLRERLVCPQDHGALIYLGSDSGTEELLYNERLRAVYRIDEGIPVLLISEARTVDDAEHAALLARAGTTDR
ncbi:Trm112 family protein [Williamsia maris]|uniref:Conserved protein YbaR, Trm112 family n=1 Tax=Williamsia maris TaxID=72806 RepID=A0ABT1HF79_9NOCA|nr:Trm112 family protein [Williamsia maris]MCP2176839.1 putative conserved protein YbaR, Trm112 family [Williamsia maris]